MKIKRLQQFQSNTTGKMVKVTKIVRSSDGTPSKDLCLVSDVVLGMLDKSSSRVILADSLRRKYTLV